MRKDEKLRQHCGTPAYIAPEILKETPYDGELADAWSAGVVLYIMLCGDFPFRSNNVKEIEQLIKKYKYIIPDDISKEARDLIQKLFVPASLRLSLAEIYKHHWMKDINASCKDIF